MDIKLKRIELYCRWKAIRMLPSIIRHHIIMAYNDYKITYNKMRYACYIAYRDNPDIKFK
jgi:hypothetical protein